MNVVRNTYPRVPKIEHAEPGDVVRWCAGRGKYDLVRAADGRTVFSRDALPKIEEDTRPLVGVIASVKNRGWFLELTP